MCLQIQNDVSTLRYTCKIYSLHKYSGEMRATVQYLYHKDLGMFRYMKIKIKSEIESEFFELVYHLCDEVNIHQCYSSI